MKRIVRKYLKLFENRGFLILILIIFIGQAASAFLLLSLISSVFLQTGSNFGVSGVVLSFAIPGFFFMAFAGLFADIFDRRKIIIFSNFFITLVVGQILVFRQAFYASIPLSFLYFIGNAFFIPASSAATAQLVSKSQLLVANSLFIFTLSSGVVLGLFAAAVIQFFFGSLSLLWVCFVLLFLAAVFSLVLPPLFPRKRRGLAIVRTAKEFWEAFLYIASRKFMWIFFIVFAFVQGVIAFGITLAPGFFEETLGLSVHKSPLLIFPLIGIGVALGTAFAHMPKLKESMLVGWGWGALGFAGAILGIVMRSGFFSQLLLLLPISLFLVSVGFGAVVCLIASRTVLQKTVPHSIQGTVFGANIILSSVFSGVMSPMGATLEVILGYASLLVWAGFVLLILGLVFVYMSIKWKF